MDQQSSTIRGLGGTLLLTVFTPVIWGSTYLVTTEFLPPQIPFSAAVIRVLPAGLLLVLWGRGRVPSGEWPRLLILSVLNIGLFQGMLFVAAYRLPGGLAAVLGAIQPLMVLWLVWLLDRRAPGVWTAFAAALAVGGMSLLMVGPGSSRDLWGILAALVGRASMASGTYLAHRWRGSLRLSSYVGWQLFLGGLVLLPIAWIFDAPMGHLDTSAYMAFVYLSLFGALISYSLWFRGIQLLNPVMVSALGLLSPVTAIILGWSILGQALSARELLGMSVVLGSVFIIQLLNIKSAKAEKRT